MAKFMALLLACNLCIIQATPICELQALFWRKSNEFANDLFKTTIAESADKNVIISPLSVQTALLLAYMGASGTTAQEMSIALKADGLSKSQVADMYKELMEDVCSSPSLKIANKIYVLEQREVKAEFNNVATKKFYSEVQKLNFTDSGLAATTINQWVEEKTNNRIQNLISPAALNQDTRMVLVNAIYFKGLWKVPFKVASTTKKPFWVSETENVEVDMMHSKEKFKYVDLPELDAKALELNYNNSDVTMLILLPNQRTGLASLEGRLNEIDFSDISGKMNTVEVTVDLPRFKIEFSVSMKDILKKMGMNRMFSDAAEFGYLFEGVESLKVSDVVHKAFIEVNEEGVEAAGATGVIISVRAMPLHPFIFQADHPFLFALKQFNEVLFLGRYLQK